MKILFVCQQYIHAARWIGQLRESGHEIYVFDCLDKQIHKDLRWTNFIENWGRRKIPYIPGEYFLEKRIPLLYKFVEPFLKVTASEKLTQLIKDIQPDLVHSLEMQTQTYPLNRVAKKIHFNWAYFSWGSDMFLFGKERKHAKNIGAIMPKIEYLFTDNSRDVTLAEKYGYKGNVATVLPGGGGYDLQEYAKYYQPIEKRNLILIKGYHHWAGRALTVLRALELIKDEMKSYEIYVFSAHDCVVKKIKEMEDDFNIKYSSRANEIAHSSLLEKFGKAKIAIGNSISDGIPNTLLEAIISGAFPIQSNPGGVSEDYIDENINGRLITNPEDENEIAEIISSVLRNDDLLKNAARINSEIAKKLSREFVRNQVLMAYDNIAKKL